MWAQLAMLMMTAISLGFPVSQHMVELNPTVISYTCVFPAVARQDAYLKKVNLSFTKNAHLGNLPTADLNSKPIFWEKISNHWQYISSGRCVLLKPECIYLFALKQA